MTDQPKDLTTAAVLSVLPAEAAMSVSQQIINQFISALAKKDGYSAISERLANLLASQKRDEVSLRAALFDEPAE